MSMVEWRQVDWKQVEWKEHGWRDSNDTTDFPSALKLLWPSKLTSSGILKSAVGPAPVFTDTPTVDADGVVPGDGPAFTSVVEWEDGGTRMIRFTASSASADLVGDVEIGGGFYAYSGGLKAKDGTNTASVSAAWASGDVVTGVVQITDDGLMRIGTPQSIYFINFNDSRLCFGADSVVWG